MTIYLYFLIFISALKLIAGAKIVCYTTNWSQYRAGKAQFLPENIDPFLCTHLIYSFAKIVDDQLAPFEPNDVTINGQKGLYQRTTDLKKINKNLKVMLAVGGWTMGSTNFSNMVTNDESRRKFVVTAVDYLKRHNFDGLDLDWEYPANREGSRPTDKRLFTVLIQELEAVLRPENLLLSAAVAATKSTIDTAYEISNIANSLDFINLMTYDYHGSWDIKVGHHSPLFSRGGSKLEKQLNIDYTVKYYIKNGAPREKLNLGLALYGRSFKLADPKKNKFGALVNGTGLAGTFTNESGLISYFEACQKLAQGWTRKWNNRQKVTYLFNNDQWIGYDDEKSLAYKMKYIKKRKLGGAMIWSMDFDDFNGEFCSKGKYPMINFIKTGLKNNSIKV